MWQVRVWTNAEVHEHTSCDVMIAWVWLSCPWLERSVLKAEMQAQSVQTLAQRAKRLRWS